MLTREVKPTRRPQTANAQPTASSLGLTYRTAVCGPACTVVWQGRVGDHSPYADFQDWKSQGLTVPISLRRHGFNRSEKESHLSGSSREPKEKQLPQR